MANPKVITQSDGTVYIERFSPVRRFEHYLTIVIFMTLVITGFPQKFYEIKWLTDLLPMMGGLDNTRLIHRIAGIIFSLHMFVHISYFLIGFILKKVRLTLLPSPQDFRDVIGTLQYYFGFRSSRPKYPKFDYQQKFEYIGIVLGGLVMAVTGLALLYPALFTSFLPGQLIPAARIMHSNEAFLALLVITIWHTYGSIFSPEVFPLETTIFTGYIEKEELKHRHGHEFDKLFPGEATNDDDSDSDNNAS